MPTCDYGRYVTLIGRCPRRGERNSSWRRFLSWFSNFLFIWIAPGILLFFFFNYFKYQRAFSTVGLPVVAIATKRGQPVPQENNHRTKKGGLCANCTCYENSESREGKLLSNKQERERIPVVLCIGYKLMKSKTVYKQVNFGYYRVSLTLRLPYVHSIHIDPTPRKEHLHLIEKKKSVLRSAWSRDVNTSQQRMRGIVFLTIVMIIRDHCQLFLGPDSSSKLASARLCPSWRLDRDGWNGSADQDYRPLGAI